MLELVKKGDTAATIFACKTLCRDRGYGDEIAITGKDGGPIETVVNDYTYDYDNVKKWLAGNKKRQIL
ncbi:MAG: hypothetical protein ACUZ8H_14605 [Candidatus Anammoxibacter sp.]